ncbi:MAG: hypothetical protein IH606_17840 [Burkholderiales bacterium]|nr:hypothetical protein [Burkholderiales bacterium]
MKPYLTNLATPHRTLPAVILALAAGLMLPLPALAGAVALATAPLATSTTSTVKPNLLLMFDNSGSMDWDHMPDDSADGGSAVTFRFGYYGMRSAQCNQVYYDPTVTYTPPVHPDGTSYSNASFSGAWTNGFSTGAGTADLRTGFRANQSDVGGNAGGVDSATNAYYYNYSGSQLSSLQRNYNSTSNVFYSECNSAENAAPGRDGFFTRISLSSTAAATTASIVVGGSSPTSTSVSGIVVNGTQQIMSGLAAASTSTGTLATNIRDQINLCTTSKVGNCTTTGGHGYTATVSGSTVTLTGLAATAQTMVITRGNSGNMTLVPTIFPAANATQLQNFANWYSYYRTRLLMMKTATGQAFSSVNKNYRVGFAKISSSGSPTVYVDTFWDNSDSVAGPVSTQRTTWYNALYNTTSSGSTPLRTALSDAGRYYAGKLGGADPVQFSCQQNFTLLSTDGYWNTGDGYKIDGSSAVGNQDGTAPRPMYDGAQTSAQWTFTYARNYYSNTRGSGSDRCSNRNDRHVVTQPQIGTCVKSSGSGSCTPSNWISNGSSSMGPCLSNPRFPQDYPGGNQTTPPVLQGSPVESAGTSGGTSDNLADIAMYYYQTDLRTTALGNCGPDNSLCENNVFQGATDKNLQQHMTTFTLGLGASGWMNYSSSYLSDTTGDFTAVKQGSTASSSATPPVCSWQADGSVCNWPVPGLSSGNGFIANVDDLWHAAVNGRGAYFSATNPKTLSAGLTNALASINSKIGAAAAAATSTLNPVAGNNFAYVASYTTVAWKGNLEARGINVDTGTVTENASWCIEDVAAQSCAAPGTVETDTSGEVTVFYCVTPNQVVCNGGELVGSDCKVQIATACTGTMNSLVGDASDTRNVYTAKSDGSAALVDFLYTNLDPADFDSSRISTLTQMQGTTLTAAQKSAAAGANLVNYLRGQHGHEFDRTSNALVDQLYRKREAVLGDALESQPAFIGAPVFSYPYPGYSSYLTDQAGRAGTVYMGTNDGMMHAFAGDTGVERWAYVPSMVLPNLWKLADTSYATNHTNYVNGSPITSDICAANCGDAATAVWKTILVAGLNGGGRGYYALDITDPAAPALLWEFKPSAPIGRPQDPDLGYSFGRAIITRKTDGTWVVLVTSGYNNGTVSSDPLVNNSPAGSGIGYLYVLNAATGAIISKISTGVGSAATPSGLAKIAGWNNEPAGNAAGFVYGGDLLGNVWRFDINTGAVLKFATLFDDLNVAQPIMTTPILGEINGKRVVFIGTGKYLETSDLTTSQKQTQYAIKDDNASATLVNPRATLVQQYLINNPDGTATRLSSGTSTAGAATATNPVDFFADRGWFVDFPDLGERVNIDARLVQGTLLVPSIVPSSTVCAPGGFGWLNFLDYKTGGAITQLPGIPMASTKYDSTIVGINVLFIQGSPIVEVVTSTNPTPKKDPDVQFRAAAAGFAGKRQNWRELIQ